MKKMLISLITAGVLAIGGFAFTAASVDNDTPSNHPIQPPV